MKQFVEFSVTIFPLTKEIEDAVCVCWGVLWGLRGTPCIQYPHPPSCVAHAPGGATARSREVSIQSGGSLRQVASQPPASKLDPYGGLGTPSHGLPAAWGPRWVPVAMPMAQSIGHSHAHAQEGPYRITCPVHSPYRYRFLNGAPDFYGHHHQVGFCLFNTFDILGPAWEETNSKQASHKHLSIILATFSSSLYSPPLLKKL